MRLYNLTMKVNRLEMLKAQIGLELVSSFDEMQKFIEQKLTDRTLEEFERQAGILGESVGDVTLAASSIVGASFHNATFSQRIWANQSLLKSEISKLLQTGMIQGRHPDVLARELRKQIEVSRFNSERLMRTEMARVQTEAQMQSFDRYGIAEYEYLACHNGDVCTACKALDGKHFKTKDAMPGDNAPPMHPFCHCSTCAWLDEEKYSQWLDSYSEHGLSFRAWQEKQNAKGINRGIINKAKGTGVFQSMNMKTLSAKTDISIDDIKAEMSKSPIGKEVLSQIEQSDVLIQVLQGVKPPSGERGTQQGNKITIYLDNIANQRVAAQTVIHEMTHFYYDIGGCQWAEAVCFAKEKMHIEKRNKLTYKELRYVVKLATDNYDELNWKKGGYRNGKTF